ncbi:hypothetical protein SAMN06297144_1666 [Sphingomonas guangdongensis]|uniref:Uncharacterized protein n=1 Tax=Sphingomonas guangdongensis TaxID=1141890 RepID=A0A285QX59_9SPHN|nr:hypothetical protein [Sphingomonas guangdongensis]SOB86560.1 hypothetical protein SAMN06297144_1666 [Sphingomonas guangdongensis]
MFSGLAFGSTLLLAVATMTQDYGSMASDSLSSAGSFAGTVGVNANLKTQPRSKQSARNVDAEARAGCANKGRAAARLGAEHPKVRRLYALCAQAGL